MCVHYRQSIRPSEANDYFSQGILDLSGAASRSNIEAGDVWADKDGPVLINDPATGELVFKTMRWGFPHYSNPKDQIVNIRNLGSSWWKNVNGSYLRHPDYRCLVPFASFAEFSQIEKKEVFFEVDAPFPVFAGIWRPWTGERLKPVPGKSRRARVADDWTLFAFLTTEPNSVVKPHHPKAMPAILTTPDECAEWMAGGEASLRLQRPLPDKRVRQVE